MPHHEIRAIKLLKEGIIEVKKDAETEGLSVAKIAGDLEALNHSSLYTKVGQLFDVKQEIYRLPDRLIYELGLFYGIKRNSAWDIIKSLAERKVINPETALHLKEALSFATTLRLKAYINNKGQDENMGFLSEIIGETDKDIIPVQQRFFSLSESDLNIGGDLFKYFYSSIPLHKKIASFFNQYISLDPSEQEIFKRSFFSEESFYEDSEENNGLIYFRLLRYLPAKTHFEAALREKPSYSQKIFLHNLLGQAYASLAQNDLSINNFEECLALLRFSSIKEKEKNIASCLNNCALTYIELGEYDKARDCLKTVLELKRYLYGEGNTTIANNLNNLGIAYSKLGQYHLAIDFYKQALHIKQIYYNINTLQMAEAYDNLGDAQREFGSFKEAQVNIQQALNIKLFIYKGHPHPSIAMSYNNLGLIAGEMADYATAERYFNISLEILKLFQVINPNNHEMVKRLCNLAELSITLEQYSRAQDLYEQSIKLLNEHHSENILLKAQTNYSFGIVFSKIEDYDRALYQYTSTLQIFESIYKRPHPDIVNCLNSIGVIKYKKGEYIEAEAYYKQALSMFKAIYTGLPHIYIANVLENLGAHYVRKGDYELGLESYNESFAIKLSIYPSDHASLASSYINLGEVKSLKKQYDLAITDYEHAINIIDKNFSSPHLQKAIALNNMGIAYHRKGLLMKALELETQGLEIKKLFFSPTHSEIASSLAAIGETFLSLKNIDQAIKYVSQALQILILPQNLSSYYLQAVEDIIEKIGEFFAHEYALKGDEIGQEIIDYTCANQDFSNYIIHLEKANKAPITNLSEIITENILVLIFLPDEEESTKADIYNKVAELTHTNVSSVKLWFASKTGDEEAIAEALTERADTNIIIEDTTPLIHLIIKRNKGLIPLLLEAGANINQTDAQQASPLYYSLGFFYSQPIDIEIIRLLLENGADPKIAMIDGDTPLHMAHHKGSTEAIRLLLQYKGEINAKNEEGKTPLHCLLEAENVEFADKIEIITQFKEFYDFTLSDATGKPVRDYMLELYPEALSFFPSEDASQGEVPHSEGSHSATDILGMHGIDTSSNS